MARVNGSFQSLGDRWGSDPTLSDPAQMYSSDYDLAISANEIAPGIVDYARQIQIFGESLIDSISRARTQLALSDAQSELLRIQIDRARQGLPPIQTTAYTSGASIDPKTLSILLVVLLGVALFRS